MMTTTTTGGQVEASSDFDNVSLDGTCGTLEEVYNARSNTVEQQRVTRSHHQNNNNSSNQTNNEIDDNSDYTGRPGSVSSMFSMSELLQQGRRIVDDIQQYQHHQQRPPSASDQYTSYHIDKEDDDTNTIDSLSDVFVLQNKKQQKQSTNPKNKNKKKSNQKSSASASVFSTASGGSSSQGSSTGTIRSFSFSIFSSTTKKTSNKSNKNKNKNQLSKSKSMTNNSTTADDTTNTEKEKEQDTDNDASLAAGSIGHVTSLHQDPSETNNDNDNNNDHQQDEENTPGSTSTVTSSNDNNESSTTTAATTAVSLKKKQKRTTTSTFPQRKHHKLWVCGLSFCSVMVVAIATVVAFHLYYEKGGNQLVVPVGHPVGSAAAASYGGYKDGAEDSGGGSGNPASSSSSISISDQEPEQKVKVDTTNYPTPTPTSHLRKSSNDNDNDIDNDNDNDNYIDNDHNSNKNDNEINNDNYNDQQSEVIDVVLSTTSAPSITHTTTIRGSSSSSQTQTPTQTTTTISPSTSPTTAFERYLDPLIEFLQDNQVYFDKDDSYSPPYLAVQWLAKEASGNSAADGGGVSISSAYGNGLPTLNDKLLQRFAVLTVEFALNRPAPLIISDASVAKTIRVSTNDVTHYEAKSDNTIGVEKVDECEWRGVTCDSGTVVEELSFGSSRFTGTIPSEIKLLQHLKVLDLSNNDLQGPIPESLYSIKELHKLYLYQNQLTGTISNQITNWYNMTHLHLSHNELSGSIPLTFISGVNIRPIEYLNVYSNQLTGTLPNNFRFRKTVFADFGRNQFSGPLPDDIGQHWVALRHLYMDHNTFTGTIPYSYPTTGNGRLENLAVNHNQLTGWVPDNWDWSIRKLLAINLHNNSFSSIGYGTCKKSVFNFGEMVEYSADCDVCKCSPFCDLKCGDGQQL